MSALLFLAGAVLQLSAPQLQCDEQTRPLLLRALVAIEPTFWVNGTWISLFHEASINLVDSVVSLCALDWALSYLKVDGVGKSQHNTERIMLNPP